MCSPINRIGKNLVRRTAIAEVVLDAEVVIRTTGVMASRQNDPAESTPFANYRARGGRRKYAVTTNEHTAKSGRSRHAQDDLNSYIVEKSAIAAENQRRSLMTFQRIKNALDKIFQISGLAKDLDLFSQSGGAGLLPGKRLGRNADSLHGILNQEQRKSRTLS